MRSTSDDLVDSMVLSSTNDVLVLGFPLVIGKEMLVSDGTNIGVVRGFYRGANEVRFMSFRVDGEGAEKLLGLV